MGASERIRGLMRQVKILLLDIETAPNLVYTWGLYDQNVAINQIVEEGYVICWAAKWLHQKKIMYDSIIDYPETFKNNPHCDRHIAESMWSLLNEADIVITHNGDKFDIKWLNTIFLKNDMQPPSSFQSIDTLKVVKKHFKFVSNKLDFLTRRRKLGMKIPHEGFPLWIKCMKGEQKSWKVMKAYCKHDVRLLEELYEDLKPYIVNHPNLTLYKGVKSLSECSVCGSKRMVKNGWFYTKVFKYRRYKCQDCGKETRDRRSTKDGSNQSTR